MLGFWQKAKVILSKVFHNTFSFNKVLRSLIGYVTMDFIWRLTSRELLLVNGKRERDA